MYYYKSVAYRLRLALVLTLLLTSFSSLVGYGDRAVAQSDKPATVTSLPSVSSGPIIPKNPTPFTREEMLNAIPADLPTISAEEAAASSQGRIEPEGPLVTIPALLPNPDGARVIELKQPEPSRPLLDNQPYPFAYNRFDVSNINAYTDYPFSTVGKVFYNVGSLVYACSASVSGQHTLVTAGHCVYSHDPSRPGWLTDRWVFVPAYQSGVAPWGQWSPREFATTGEFLNNNWAYDVAIVILFDRVDGRSISSFTGSLGSEFNGDRSQYEVSLGYPEAAPFTGGRMMASYGWKADDDLSVSPARIGMGNDMTEGASGGPWVLRLGTSNLVNSVNSVKLAGKPLAMYGPYFGDSVMNLYSNHNGRGGVAITSYEAESWSNTLNGAARGGCSSCSGGQKVGWIGYGNSLQFNNVWVPSSGSYQLTIYYATGETRNASLSLNGGGPIPRTFSSTGGWEKVGSYVLIISLNAGNNTIRFYNDGGWTPDIDRIIVN